MLRAILTVSVALSGCSIIADGNQFVGSGTDAGIQRDSAVDGAVDAGIDSGPGPETCDECLGPCEEGPRGGVLCCDADGDGFGPPGVIAACRAFAPDILDAPDCNDANPAVFPGAFPVCNDGVVNDCDGGLDVPIFSSLGLQEVGVDGPTPIGNASPDIDPFDAMDVALLAPEAEEQVRYVAVFQDPGGETQLAFLTPDAVSVVGLGVNASSNALGTHPLGLFLAIRGTNPRVSELFRVGDDRNLVSIRTVNALPGVSVGVATPSARAPRLIIGVDDGSESVARVCRAGAGSGGPACAMGPWRSSVFRYSGALVLGEGQDDGYVLGDAIEGQEQRFPDGFSSNGGKPDILVRGEDVFTAFPGVSEDGAAPTVLLRRRSCADPERLDSCEAASTDVRLPSGEVFTVGIGAFGDGVVVSSVELPVSGVPEVVARYVAGGAAGTDGSGLVLSPTDFGGDVPEFIEDLELSGIDTPIATTLAFGFVSVSRGGNSVIYWAGAIHGCKVR